MPDWDTDPRLATKTVAIIGCGGLGSNAAQMLVRAGVGRLVLVDFDTVSESNLNRQFYFADQIGRDKTEALAENLRRIRPGVDLRLLPECVDAAGVVRAAQDADVGMEAVDTAAGKAMIMAAFLDHLPHVPLVTASGLAGCGSANTIATERLCENVYLVGDLVSDVTAGLPLYASRVMVAAAAQAHMVVRLLLGETQP